MLNFKPAFLPCCGALSGLAASEARRVVGLAKARLPVTPNNMRQRWANAGWFVLADDPEIGDAAPEFDTSTLRELIHPPFRNLSGLRIHAHVESPET